ncbi:MAG: beta strand repeat-containing protein, partial [Acidimicrobiales bacterium]
MKATTFLVSLLTTAGFAAGFAVAPASAATAHALATTNLGYTPLTSPVRIADTRSGATSPATYAGKTLAEGTSLTVDIPATAGVPSNAGAVVVNIAAIAPAAAGFLAVYPGGTSNPGTANVVFSAGQNVDNLVTVGLGPDAATGAAQSFTVYDGPSSIGGNVDFAADLEGYYAPQTSSSGAAFVGLTPARIFDSRASSGQPGAGTTLTNGGSDNVTVTGVGGVPANASAVVLNLAVTNATSSSFVYAYPTGSAPTTPVANQNFLAGETLSSKVIVGVGTGGAITVANHAGNVDIVADVDGYFTPAGASGSLFNALATPMRLTDTRPSTLAGGSSTAATVSGVGATAGVLNVTDIYEATSGGNYLTVYPTGTNAPLAADVNFSTGDTYNIVANASYALTGPSSSVSILNGPASAGPAAVVVDEFGYFAPQAAAPAYTVTPSSPSTVQVSSGTPSNNAGVVTYSASGLPTAAGTTVNIALFPCTAPNAPSGDTFTPTTANTAGPAAGEGTTTVDTGNGTGNVGAVIASVNGVPTTGTAPVTIVYGVTATNGSLSFVVNSLVPDCAIPVVYTAPSTAGTTPALEVTATGTPQSGYAVGTGGSTTWSAAAAAAGTYSNYVVTSTNPTAHTFQACTTASSTKPFLPTTTCSTFIDNAAGDTYNYVDPAITLTTAQFEQYLSGVSTQAASAGPAYTIPGDGLATISYNPSGPSTFKFGNAGANTTNGDVPAAPTGLGVAAGSSGGVTLSWTAVPNPDVTTDASATYNIYRATVTSGTVGTYGTQGSPLATVVAGGASATTTYTDSSAVPGTTYSYVVSATSGTAGGAQEGPASSAVQFTPTSAAAAPQAPVSIATGYATCGTCGSTNFVPGDSLTFTFNGPVTFNTTGWNLVVTDGTNEVQLGATNTTPTVASVGGGTNNAVTYTENSQPTVITGTNPLLTNLEALSQSGVSNTVGAWNLPGSGAYNDAGVTRVVHGANTALTAAPGVTTVGANATSISGTCTATDIVKLYSLNGALLGSIACAGGGTFTIPVAVSPATTYLVTQTATAAGAYEGQATEVVGISPNPIGSGTTAAAPAAISLTINDIPGA